MCVKFEVTKITLRSTYTLQTTRRFDELKQLVMRPRFEPYEVFGASEVLATFDGVFKPSSLHDTVIWFLRRRIILTVSVKLKRV